MDVNFKKRKPSSVKRIGNIIWSSITGEFYISSKELSDREKVSKNTVDAHLNNKKILPLNRKYQKVKIFNKLEFEVYDNLQKASKETLVTMSAIYSDIFGSRSNFDYVIPTKMAIKMMKNDRNLKDVI